MKSVRKYLIEYGSAVAFVAMAALFRHLLTLLDPKILIFASFYPAILASALLHGFGPAVFALALSAGVGWLSFMAPSATSAVSLAQIINVLFFLMSGSIIAWLGSAYRALLKRVRDEEGKRALLIKELQHRNKNALAVANAIIKQTLKSQPAVADTLVGRLGALFATNDLLTQSQSDMAVLGDIVATELAPYGAERAQYDGPHVQLEGGLARSFALIFHELATNAAKYGALSSPHGQVDVHWSLDQGRLSLVWREAGGPEPQVPTAAGFGTSLIQRSLSGHGGDVVFSWPSSGAVCNLTCPMARRPSSP